MAWEPWRYPPPVRCLTSGLFSILFWKYSILLSRYEILGVSLGFCSVFLLHVQLSNMCLGNLPLPCSHFVCKAISHNGNLAFKAIDLGQKSSGFSPPFKVGVKHLCGWWEVAHQAADLKPVSHFAYTHTRVRSEWAFSWRALSVLVTSSSSAVLFGASSHWEIKIIIRRERTIWSVLMAALTRPHKSTVECWRPDSCLKAERVHIYWQARASGHPRGYTHTSKNLVLWQLRLQQRFMLKRVFPSVHSGFWPLGGSRSHTLDL